MEVAAQCFRVVWRLSHAGVLRSLQHTSLLLLLLRHPAWHIGLDIRPVWGKAQRAHLAAFLDDLKLLVQAQGWMMPLQRGQWGSAFPNSSALIQAPKSGPGFPGAFASWICLSKQTPAGMLSNFEQADPCYCCAKKTLSAGCSPQRDSWNKQAGDTVRSSHLFALCDSRSLWKHLAA